MSYNEATGTTELSYVGAGIILAGSVLLGWKVWRWRTARYVLTDHRLMYMEGIVSRRVTGLPLRSVLDTTFHQNWSRMQDAGLFRGAYHFGRPGHDPEIQAALFASLVGAPSTSTATSSGKPMPSRRAFITRFHGIEVVAMSRHTGSP